MLDLAGIPLKAADRKDLTPIICCGGPCTCNPEPITKEFSYRGGSFLSRINPESRMRILYQFSADL